MKTEIPYDFIPAEQHFNSPEQLLSAIERYQETRVFGHGDKRFNAPEDKFEKLAKEDGGYVLMPVASDYAFLFRGQGRFHYPCLPTLLRTERSPEQLFIERMRIVEFELMLKQYPAVQYFEHERYEVDYVGLAQHYGLNTDVLDLTSDVRTALFFAMCDYDRIEDCYRPKHHDKEYIGYLYAYPVIGEIMDMQRMMAGNFLMHDLRVIGLQPFTRPGAQRGFSLHIEDTKPFKGYLYSFSYSKKDSELFFDEMVNKRHVWDKDFIVEKTKLIRDTDIFTGDALALATKRYGGKATVAKMQKLMNANGIHFSYDVPWKLAKEEQNKLAAQFKSGQRALLNSQIIQRGMQQDGKMYPVTTLSFAAHQLVLQTIQGGEPCIDEYDSGIKFFLEDNPPIVGWGFDTARPQTMPDKDGKVSAFDQILKCPDADSPEAIARRESLRKRVKKATRPFRLQTWFVTKDGEQLADAQTFFKKQEEFSLALINGDREKAEELDEDLMDMVGAEGRIDLRRARMVNPRPLIWYSSNRAMLKLQLGRVEEAAFCMNEAARTMHVLGYDAEIYFMLDGLAQTRGKHDIFSSPFELACDYLMMAVMGQYYFMGISLSFMWKAKIIFDKLGYADIARFVDGLIGMQCSLLAEIFKTDDPEGAAMFAKYAEKLKGTEKIEWPQKPFGGNDDNLTLEEKQKIYGPMNPRLMTLEDEKLLSKHWPAFDYDGSMISKLSRRSGKNGVGFPNILELMDIISYEEEKYALQCQNTRLTDIILGDPHYSDGNLERVVAEDGRYQFLPKGIINGVFFRGQAKFYDKCGPSLFRDLSDKEQFIERVKLCEFSILLRKHPSAKLFVDGAGDVLKDGRTERHEMSIDEEALAQHYGILTEYLDLTTDKWVAAFFACTDYHRTSSGLRDDYVKHRGQDTGVFYVYQDLLERKYSGELHSVGLQPFSRPVYQSGYVLKMDKNQDFNDLAHGIRFCFDSGCTSIIYWLFDQSMKIQPEEVIELKAKRIAGETTTFSRAAYTMAHQRYFSELTEEDFLQRITDYALKIQETPLVDFTSEEIERAWKDDFAIQNGSLMRRVMSRQIMTIPLNEDNASEG